MVHQVEYCLWSLISILVNLFQLLRKAITMAPISCKCLADLSVSARKRPPDDHVTHREIFESRQPELLNTVGAIENKEHRDHLDSKVGDGLVINGESVHGDLRMVRMRALDSTDIVSTVVDGAMVSNKARKRPTRIMIPVSYAGLGLEGVEKDHAVEKELEVEGNGYFLASRKGRRHTMEDGYGVLTNIHGDSKQALFGVFDGHGGRAAVDFVIENLGKNIITEVSKMDEDDDGQLEVGIKNGYFTTDTEFLNKGVNSGACVATVLLKNGDLHVSNVGDCRVVMSRNGVANALTRDHRAGRDDERARIESSGGYISCRNGVWRVEDSLAVSRAIGDLNLKEWVISEPETKKLRLTPDCEFLVMASDGLWDKVSNQEAIDAVSRYKNSIKSCKELVDMASRRGNRDDITVMVVDLQRFVQLGG